MHRLCSCAHILYLVIWKFVGSSWGTRKHAGLQCYRLQFPFALCVFAHSYPPVCVYLIICVLASDSHSLPLGLFQSFHTQHWNVDCARDNFIVEISDLQNPISSTFISWISKNTVKKKWRQQQRRQKQHNSNLLLLLLCRGHCLPWRKNTQIKRLQSWSLACLFQTYIYILFFVFFGS